MAVQITEVLCQEALQFFCFVVLVSDSFNEGPKGLHDFAGHDFLVGFVKTSVIIVIVQVEGKEKHRDVQQRSLIDDRRIVRDQNIGYCQQFVDIRISGCIDKAGLIFLRNADFALYKGMQFNHHAVAFVPQKITENMEVDDLQRERRTSGVISPEGRGVENHLFRLRYLRIMGANLFCSSFQIFPVKEHICSGDSYRIEFALTEGERLRVMTGGMLRTHNHMSVILMCLSQEHRCALLSQSFKSDGFECATGMPQLHQLDIRVVLIFIQLRLIIIRENHIRGCQIMGKAEFLPETAPRFDAVLERKFEYIFVPQAPLEHTFIDELLVPGQLISPVGSEEDLISLLRFVVEYIKDRMKAPSGQPAILSIHSLLQLLCKFPESGQLLRKNKGDVQIIGPVFSI